MNIVARLLMGVAVLIPASTGAVAQRVGADVDAEAEVRHPRDERPRPAPDVDHGRRQGQDAGAPGGDHQGGEWRRSDPPAFDRGGEGRTGHDAGRSPVARPDDGRGRLDAPSWRGDDPASRRSPGQVGPDRFRGGDRPRPDQGRDWRGDRRDDAPPRRIGGGDDRGGWTRDGGGRQGPGWTGNDRGYQGNRRGDWTRDWRQDRRYDWGRYRAGNRSVYRLPRYYAPYGWGYGYRRFPVGVTLASVLWNRTYWIDDPYAYRLPEAYGPYRWVRYYDDALLVDVRSGRVVDVVYDIFW